MDKLTVSSEAFAPVLEDILSAGGTASVVVSGSSMYPFLKHGRDAVSLRAHTEADLKRGQILLFKRKNQSLVLHRIRKILPDGKLLMNGDAQTWSETISTHQVLAVVTSVERKGRSMSCEQVWFRLWNLLWYPTRPIRGFLFKLGRLLLKRGKHR